MIRRPPRSTRVRSSAASDVYKRQLPLRPYPDQGADGEEERDACCCHRALAVSAGFWLSAQPFFAASMAFCRSAAAGSELAFAPSTFLPSIRTVGVPLMSLALDAVVALRIQGPNLRSAMHGSMFLAPVCSASPMSVASSCPAPPSFGWLAYNRLYMSWKVFTSVVSRTHIAAFSARLEYSFVLAWSRKAMGRYSIAISPLSTLSCRNVPFAASKA